MLFHSNSNNNITWSDFYNRFTLIDDISTKNYIKKKVDKFPLAAKCQKKKYERILFRCKRNDKETEIHWKI